MRHKSAAAVEKEKKSYSSLENVVLIVSQLAALRWSAPSTNAWQGTLLSDGRVNVAPHAHLTA